MASNITKGAIISYVSIFLNIGINLIYAPWMLSQIGVTNFGLYNLVVTFISYFILDFGLAGTIARFIAKYRTENNHRKIEQMLGLTTKVYMSIDFCIFLVLLVIYPFLDNIFTGLTPTEVSVLKVLYIIAGICSILTFILQPMNGAMMAFEYFVENKAMDMLQKVGTVILIVIALALDGDVYDLVLITGAAGFLSSFGKYIIFKRKSHVQIDYKYFDKSEMKNLLSFSGWVFLIGIAQRFRLSLMPSLLGILSNSTEISIFSMGMMIEGMIYTLSSALNGLFLPKVTRMLHENDINAVNNLLTRVGRIQLYIIGVILIGFWVFGRPFIQLWVGDVFKDSYLVVILLTGTNIVSLTQHVAENVVYAENKVRFTSTLTFVSSAFALVFSLLLAGNYGAIGCALAFFVATSINLVLINIFYHKTLGLDLRQFFKNCHHKIAPSLLLLGVCFLTLSHLWVVDNWFKLILGVIIFGIMAISLIYFVLMNNDEKEMINHIIKRPRND